MPYTIHQLANLPAPTVVATMLEPFDSLFEPALSVKDVDTTLAQVEGDAVYLIIDMSRLNLNLGNLIQGFAGAFMPHESVSTEHVFADRVRTLMIGTGALMNLAVSAASQEQYGNRQLELFPSVNAALDHIRQTVKA